MRATEFTESGSTEYNILRQLSKAADVKLTAASDELNKFPKGPMGITPDAVKQDPAWQRLKKEADNAFAELRHYNGLINKNHKKEHQAARKAERAKRYNVQESGAMPQIRQQNGRDTFNGNKLPMLNKEPTDSAGLNLPGKEHDIEKMGDAHELKKLTKEMLSKLPARMANVIFLRFFENYTLQEIADHYGISTERVGQIGAKALRKLRHPSISGDVKIFTEGGWSSVATQDTVITPQTIADTIPVMQAFQDSLNKSLVSAGIPPILIGNPVGSGTYYKRDLKSDPTKEYGDIDVQFIMPRVEGRSNNQVQKMYFDAVQEFCRINGNFETDNGKNVIFQIGTDFIQVDLVAIFDDRVEFTKALAPEHGTKGVLSGSLYSALGQALNISISDAGVRGKTIDDKLVSYRKSKGTTLNTISTDHSNWAMDIARFMGATTADPLLSQNPGMKDEVKIADIINSFKGIALTLARNQILPDQYSSAGELIAAVRDIYLQKIDAVINSSKFDKAEGDAVAKAKKTKEMLATRSQEIARLFAG